MLLCAAIVFVVTLAESWDRILAARTDPEAEDAYAHGRERPISARVAGYVTAVLVDDNQVVAAGQPIATLERDNYEAVVRSTGASLAQARDMLAALEERLGAAEAEAEAAGAAGKAIGARSTFADQQAARERKVLPTALGLLRAAQQAAAEARGARAETAAENEVIRQREQDVRVVEAELRAERAEVALRQARLDGARLALGYTVIRAPVAGQLGTRQVHRGDLADVGREIITLTPLDDIWVMAFLKETQLTHVRIGQPVSVRFDAWPSTTLAGRVDQIAPLTLQQRALVQPDNTTGNYTKVVQRVPVKITFDPGPLKGLIRPGMSALVRVQTTTGAAPVVTAR